MKTSLVLWIAFWVCLIGFIISLFYHEVLENPLSSHLSRMDTIQKEYDQLTREAQNLMQDSAALKAEVKDKTSWLSLLGVTARSAWDGLTWGEFSEEGIFTENKKLERWKANVTTRDARRIERGKQILASMEALEGEAKELRPMTFREYQHYRWTGIIRSWSLRIGVVLLISAVIVGRRGKTKLSQLS